MAKANNYTTILTHKERIKIQYTDFEVRGRIELYLILIISMLFSAPFYVFNLYIVFIVFILTFIGIILSLQLTDNESGNYQVVILILNLMQKNYVISTKHFKQNRYVTFREKKYKFSKQIYILDYKG